MVFSLANDLVTQQASASVRI